jgi:hypothetical protein
VVGLEAAEREVQESGAEGHAVVVASFGGRG